MTTFGEQTRALRIAWVLDGLFNARTGYAHPSNPYLAGETGIAINKVRAALAELEAGGAIVRTVTRSRNGTRREIYPAATLLGGSPTVGLGGEPQQAGRQNLRRYLRRPEIAHARAASALHEARAAERAGTQEVAEPGASEDAQPHLRLVADHEGASST